MPPTNLLQGTLDLLILKALALTEMHGLGISHRIAQITKDTFRVKPGSGRRQLKTETEQWETIALAIASALQAS